ncbi:MAG: transposase [Bacteroidota bacterium]
MDTHLTNISVFAELMGIDNKTLHHWYKDFLSDFEPNGQREIHTHDIIVKTGNIASAVEVPIICPDNISSDMGIDEKMIGEEWYTLLTNRQTGKIAFCAATTKSDHLQQAMSPLLSHLDKIKTITRDMAGSYAKLCNNLIPAAIQIADKFHVISNLMDAQQAVRIRYRQKILEQRRTALQLFKQEEKQCREECERNGRKYFAKKFNYIEQRLSNGETPSELLARSHFLLYKFSHQWKPSQKIRAKTLFENFPEIEKAYKLACQFRTWYARDNIGCHPLQIEKELFMWYENVEDSDIDEMSNFKSLVESNEEVIMAYFLNGYTNAVAENLNGKIKKFIGSNQGVRNRDFFFFRIKNFFT